MSSTLIPANINIADRIYRVQLSPDDEQNLRQSVKLINDKIIEFKSQIPGKDIQDYLSMVLVWFATESSKKSVSLADETQILENLERLELLIDSGLKS